MIYTAENCIGNLVVIKHLTKCIFWSNNHSFRHFFFREFHYGPETPTEHQHQIDDSKKGTQPPESTFKKLAPSKNRYTLLRDELWGSFPFTILVIFYFVFYIVSKKSFVFFLFIVSKKMHYLKRWMFKTNRYFFFFFCHS